MCSGLHVTLVVQASTQSKAAVWGWTEGMLATRAVHVALFALHMQRVRETV